MSCPLQTWIYLYFFSCNNNWEYSIFSPDWFWYLIFPAFLTWLRFWMLGLKWVLGKSTKTSFCLYKHIFRIFEDSLLFLDSLKPIRSFFHLVFNFCSFYFTQFPAITYCWSIIVFHVVFNSHVLVKYRHIHFALKVILMSLESIFCALKSLTKTKYVIFVFLLAGLFSVYQGTFY